MVAGLMKDLRAVHDQMHGCTLCLDAGGITDELPLKAQQKIRHILISHPHLDHTCTLPLLRAWSRGCS